MVNFQMVNTEMTFFEQEHCWIKTRGSLLTNNLLARHWMKLFSLLRFIGAKGSLKTDKKLLISVFWGAHRLHVWHDCANLMLKTHKGDHNEGVGMRTLLYLLQYRNGKLINFEVGFMKKLSQVRS